MLFASIWIFTLGLPWQKGAEFFMKYLFDGDAASNTFCDLCAGYDGSTSQARVAEVIIFNNRLNRARAELIMAYLKAKYTSVPLKPLIKPTGGRRAVARRQCHR